MCMRDVTRTYDVRDNIDNTFKVGWKAFKIQGRKPHLYSSSNTYEYEKEIVNLFKRKMDASEREKLIRNIIKEGLNTDFEVQNIFQQHNSNYEIKRNVWLKTKQIKRYYHNYIKGFHIFRKAKSAFNLCESTYDRVVLPVFYKNILAYGIDRNSPCTVSEYMLVPKYKQIKT